MTYAHDHETGFHSGYYKPNLLTVQLFEATLKYIVLLLVHFFAQYLKFTPGKRQKTHANCKTVGSDIERIHIFIFYQYLK